MATNIKLKRSSVAGKKPTTSDLQLGELGLNSFDGKLFTKISRSGVESIVGIGGEEPGNQYFVTKNGVDTNDGKSIGGAFATVKAALAVATSGDTVQIGPGTYTEIFPLDVPAGVAVVGAGLRSTFIQPTSGTKDLDGFRMNGETEVTDLTIGNFFYNTTNDTGYGFRFKSGMKTTTRSPYVQRVTVFNKGSVTSSTDPFGFDTVDNPPVSYVSGRGALVDGSVVDATTLEPAMFFNECTFICPNNVALKMTNGARSEWVNCFTYFCSKSIDAVDGSTGVAGSGKTRLKLSGLTVTTTPVANDVIYYLEANYRTGTYTRTGTTVTITQNSHGLSNGDKIYADYTSGTATDGFYTVSNVATNTFDVTDPNSGSISTSNVSFKKALAYGTIDSYSSGTTILTNKGTGTFTTAVATAGKTVTASGNASLSTAQKKFGTASLSLDGVDDYATIADSSDFNFGTGDFTIEFWIRPSSIGTQQVILDSRTSSGDTAIYLEINTAGNIRFFTANAYRLTSSVAVTANNWSHVALSRSSGVTRIFVNGTLTPTTYSDSNDYSNRSFRIGGNFTGSIYYGGYVDEFRISNTARYTSTFTTASGQFNSDGNDKILLHFDGINGSTSFIDSSLPTQDVRFVSGTTTVTTASKITLADYQQFGAEMRSIGSASVFGTQGVTANGPGCTLRLFAYNFGHVGAGKDFSQDETLVVQSNEAVETNGGKVYFVSIDQGGDFRVGDAFYVSQRDGTVNFGGQDFTLNSLSDLNVTDGTNTTTITPVGITVGNLNLTGNTLSTTSGNLTIDPSGSSSTTINGDVSINGTLTATTASLSGIIQGNTQVTITDTGANGTINLVADATTVQSVTSTGATITGTLTVSGNTTFQSNAYFGDNDSAYFGDGSDLRIYHDGTNSYVADIGTGNLILDTNGVGVVIKKFGTSENIANFFTDGAVELYYDNVKKFETTTTGVTIVGNVVADGIRLGDNDGVYFGDSEDLKIYHDGTNSVISDVGTGKLLLYGNDGIFFQSTTSNDYFAKYISDAGVELYYDNSKKFETTTSGVLVTGTVTAKSAATQDGVIISGRAGGTGDFDVTITPTTLSADRTLTLANGDTTLQAGTMAITGGTLAQFAATTSSQLAGVISDETGSGALVFANTPTLVTPILGTPQSGNLSNCTNLPVSTGISGLATGIATFLQTPTSSNLATAITDETGSGALVFATSPTLVTPTLGAATATTINKVTITAPTTSATLTIADGKTLTVSNTLTFTGTDSSSVAFGSGGTVAYTANKLSVFAATTSAELAGVISDETGSGALVFANTPTLVTPNIGAATGSSLTVTGNIVSGSGASTVTLGSDGNIEIYRSGGGAYIDFKDASGDDYDVRLSHTNATTTLALTGSLSVSGDLIVNGTTTTINSTTITVDDKNIELGSVTTPTDVTADGGGITLKGTTDKTINWIDATDAWTSSEHWNLLTGKEYRINGTAVLTSSQVLGKSVPSGTIVGTTDTQTLTNKTLQDSTTTFQDDADTTKQMRFQLSGITTNNTRLLTVPDSDGTLALRADVHYIGTTSIALNRASASQALTGITSIDGSAATLTTTRTLWGQNFNGGANVTGDLTSVGNITFNAATTLSSAAQTAASTASTAVSIRTGNASGTTSNSGDITVDVGTATATAGSINIGTTNATAVHLPTAKTKVGQTFLIQGVAGNITFPSTAGTLVGSGDTGSVTNTMLAGSIAPGKLTLNSANIIVGNASNVGAAVAMSGDATISNAGALTIANSAVTFAKIQNSAAAGLSVIGRSANTAGVFAEIAAGTDGHVLRRSGTALGFGEIATAGIANSAVTYAKIQNVSATDRLLGRSTAGAGVIEEITCGASGRSLLGLTAVQGGILYGSSTSAYGIINAGTSGQFLKSAGTGAPTWSTLEMTDIPGAVYKKSVKAATIADLGTVTYANGTAGVGATITGPTGASAVVFPAQDGVNINLNDRILVKDQTTAAQNGIYTLTTVGVAATTAWVLTRATDADSNIEIGAAVVAIDEGTTNGGEAWTTNFKSTDTVGTTAMSWNEILYNNYSAPTFTGTLNAATITASGNLTVSGGAITAGNIATALLGGNTTTNITLGSGLTTGTLTLGSATGSGTIAIGNTGTAAAQAVNIATATTGTITIGGTGATAVQLPTGKTKVGQTFLLQGVAGNITLPSTAGTLVGSGDTGTVSTTMIAGSAVTYAKIQNVSATDRLLGRSTAGAGVIEEITCTAAGRALLDDADAAAQRTTLGLGTIATQAANNVSISGGSVTGITDITLADGGTNASLVAANGGVVYSTASALAIGTAGSSGQLLVSKGTAAPVFETFDLSLHAPHASYKSVCKVATTADLAPSTFLSDVLTGYDDTITLACTTTAGSAIVTTTTTVGIKVGASVSGNVNIPAGRTVASIDSATQFTLNSATTVTAGTNVNTTFTQTIAALAIDGVTLAVNDRVLVKDQATLGGLSVLDAAKYNGIYKVTATGSTTVPWTLTRTDDANVATDLDGAIVNISEGTANYGKSYKTRFKGTDTLNTTEMYWGRIVDVNSSSYGVLPVTKVGVDLSSDTETVKFKTGNLADLVTGLSLGIKTVQSFAASTYTNASTLYIEGAPAAGTNATITNAYALQVAAGNTLLGGNLIVANVDSSGTTALNIGTGANAKTITIGNATGATSVVLNCGTGALNIGTNTIARTITIGNQTGASALTLDSGTGAINIGTAIAKTITIGNTTGATGVVINAGTGGVTLPSGLTKVGTSTLTQGSATARTITFPDATTTLVGTDATQTLSGKTYLIPYTEGAGTVLTATAETTNQVLFPAAGDNITLTVGVYEVKMLVFVTRGATSTTASQLRINFLGAGTAVGTFSGRSVGWNTGTSASTAYHFAAVNINTNNTVAPSISTAGGSYQAEISGIIKITTSGTLIPAYGLTAALSGATTTTTCNATNYMRLIPISTSGTTTAQGGFA